ncbi:hypothetical protein RRG08_054504 [Elysia crispata]|uniref:Uncharacterized protein n=1 Tax=Elysia crispata TaxID=231223 RepID=A0AAE0YVZ8_9GAST|nr:hypothetical protein RRG08_054504 [Elysia crispata]
MLNLHRPRVSCSHMKQSICWCLCEAVSSPLAKQIQYALEAHRNTDRQNIYGAATSLPKPRLRLAVTCNLMKQSQRYQHDSSQVLQITSDWIFCLTQASEQEKKTVDPSAPSLAYSDTAVADVACIHVTNTISLTPETRPASHK